MSEKPFCDAQNSKSIDIGLRSQEFLYLYLKIVLSRNSPSRHPQCITGSKELLHLLLHLSPESDEPYHPFLWQFLYSPFTAFLLLFREILLSSDPGSEGNKEALAAMENLPGFLEKMTLRTSLAARLREASRVLIDHAKFVLDSGPSAAGSEGPVAMKKRLSRDTTNFHDLDLSRNQSVIADAARNTFRDFNADDVFESLNQDFEGNELFDWLSWLGET